MDRLYGFRLWTACIATDLRLDSLDDKALIFEIPGKLVRLAELMKCTACFGWCVGILRLIELDRIACTPLKFRESLLD